VSALASSPKLVALPERRQRERWLPSSKGLSVDGGIDGILLQHPPVAGVDERAAFEAIASHKDVDGVTKDSFASMAFGLPIWGIDVSRHYVRPNISLLTKVKGDREERLYRSRSGISQGAEHLSSSHRQQK
jgi:hypothetical protein